MRFANRRNLPPSKVLRLPWPEWGDTDVMLGMAAELHDRLMCSCGCGQWEADAHDPDKADQWVPETETCYARRSLDAYVEQFKPDADQVLSVRLVPDRAEADRSVYADLMARHGASFAARKPHSEEDAPGNQSDEDG